MEVWGTGLSYTEKAWTGTEMKNALCSVDEEFQLPGYRPIPQESSLELIGVSRAVRTGASGNLTWVGGQYGLGVVVLLSHTCTHMHCTYVWTEPLLMLHTMLAPGSTVNKTNMHLVSWTQEAIRAKWTNNQTELRKCCEGNNQGLQEW